MSFAQFVKEYARPMNRAERRKFARMSPQQQEDYLELTQPELMRQIKLGVAKMAADINQNGLPEELKYEI